MIITVSGILDGKTLIFIEQLYSNGCQPARFIVGPTDRREGRQWTWRADNHCWRADSTACRPKLQSRYYYYHHIELFSLHSPGCDREKTAPWSWPSIVKRCSRDTVVCIVVANNMDGHPIRKIVAKAFIRQNCGDPSLGRLTTPVTQMNRRADNDVAHTIRQSKNKSCFIDTWLKWRQVPSDCSAMWW